MAALWDPQRVLRLPCASTGGRYCLGTVTISSPYSCPMPLSLPPPTHDTFGSTALAPPPRPASDDLASGPAPIPRPLIGPPSLPSSSPHLQHLRQQQHPQHHHRRRCTRPLRPAELQHIRQLLQAMAREMPDQVDHTVLLHLARACLCVESPNPHRGVQEAAIIYAWTELLAREAEAMRARGVGCDVAGESPGIAAPAASSAVDGSQEMMDVDGGAAANVEKSHSHATVRTSSAVEPAAASFSPHRIWRERARGMTLTTAVTPRSSDDVEFPTPEALHLDDSGLLDLLSDEQKAAIDHRAEGSAKKPTADTAHTQPPEAAEAPQFTTPADANVAASLPTADRGMTLSPHSSLLVLRSRSGDGASRSCVSQAGGGDDGLYGPFAAMANRIPSPPLFPATA